MSKDTFAIKCDILSVIQNQDKVLPGRAGETPRSKLGEQFEKLEVEDAEIAAAALGEIIDNPPIIPDVPPREFWFTVSLLAQHLHWAARRFLANPFRRQLFGKGKLDDGSLLQVMHGFIASGGELTRYQLMNDLISLRSSDPIPWIGAAIHSSIFGLAAEELFKLVVEEKLISLEKKEPRFNLYLFCSVAVDWMKKWPEIIFVVRRLAEETRGEERQCLLTLVTALRAQQPT